MTSKRKVAIVTGASRGIGAALAKRLRDLDYGVVATAEGGVSFEEGVDHVGPEILEYFPPSGVSSPAGAGSAWI